MAVLIYFHTSKKGNKKNFPNYGIENNLRNSNTQVYIHLNNAFHQGVKALFDKAPGSDVIEDILVKASRPRVRVYSTDTHVALCVQVIVQSLQLLDHLQTAFRTWWKTFLFYKQTYA